MNISQAIKKVISHKDLSIKEMQDVMHSIMSGNNTEAQIAGLLTAIATKGEAISEIVGAAKVMRELSTKVDIENTERLVDTCGTGGDGLNIFNVSTAAAFVAATAGVSVAKHGNRSISSSSGSADLLEAAGADLSISSESIAKSVKQINIGFMFAQSHHLAMKHAISVRKQLGVRTIFNLLGPLTNPAGANNQIIGVYDKDLTPVIAKVLQELGSKNVMVVHSVDGMDEISIFAKTFVTQLTNGKIDNYEINPADFGFKGGDINNIKVFSSQESLALIKESFAGKSGEAADMIAINAGAAIYMGGKADNLAHGIKQAQQILASGQATKKLDDFIKITKNN